MRDIRIEQCGQEAMLSLEELSRSSTRDLRSRELLLVSSAFCCAPALLACGARLRTGWMGCGPNSFISLRRLNDDLSGVVTSIHSSACGAKVMTGV